MVGIRELQLHYSTQFGDMMNGKIRDIIFESLKGEIPGMDLDHGSFLMVAKTNHHVPDRDVVESMCGSIVLDAGDIIIAEFTIVLGTPMLYANKVHESGNHETFKIQVKDFDSFMFISHPSG
jgi:hypothetical protein